MVPLLTAVFSMMELFKIVAIVSQHASVSYSLTLPVSLSSFIPFTHSFIFTAKHLSLLTSEYSGWELWNDPKQND